MIAAQVLGLEMHDYPAPEVYQRFYTPGVFKGCILLQPGPELGSKPLPPCRPSATP